MSRSIAFRFVFVYFVLFCLATQISGSLLLIPPGSFRGFGTLWPMRSITLWVAAHVFGITDTLVYGRNTGETVFYWVQTFWILVAAIILTIVWSAVDRNRENYQTLQKWFHVFVRLALAASMFEYGMTKVIPTQFPRPSLTTLVTPVGDLSLSALLWATIGASPAYEIATGCAELLGGLLLLLPRTVVWGALICLADMAQVFLLNMTYDIGLKQISFHLILLSLLLLVPPFRAAGTSSRLATLAQLAFGLYLVGVYAYVNWTYLNVAGDRSPRSPLYGIWNVEQLSVDGAVRPPSMNDYGRQWRRAIFDTPGAMVFQRLDDSFARYGAAIDVYGKTISLTKGESKKWKSSFAFQQPSSDQLVIDGEMDGHQIHAQFRLADFDTFRLLNSTFRWVRPEE